jgi:nitrous oxide reductase accessory protein NosL
MRLACLLVSLALVACGGSDGGPNQAPAEIDLTATGATAGGNPTVNIDIPSGGQVHFVNKDTKPHQITSASCPELNTKQLAPSEDSGLITLTGPKPCSFTDSLNPGNNAYNGNITVSAPGTPGGGY